MTESDDAATDQMVDLYREVHKGPRLALFELVRDAGALDVGSADAVTALQWRVGDVEMLLDVHDSHQTGAALGALIADHAGAAGTVIEDGHAELTARIATIGARALAPGEAGSTALCDPGSRAALVRSCP